MHALVAVTCLLLSGFAGLVYEVCWIRQASLVFGSTTFALSSVLAVFFGGLALGAWWAGRRALSTDRPMRWYAALETALALLALLSGPAFVWADQLYGVAYQRFEGAQPLLFFVRIVLVALVLLLPASVMGATLPLVCRQLIARRERIGALVALLYAANTIGAAAGCFAAGFWLIRHVGISASIQIAVAVNLLAAALAFAYRWRPPEAATPQRTAPALTPRARRVGGLFFLSGFAAVGGEVAWTRFLSLLVEHDVHSYTITLGVILIGIVLGALLAARLSDSIASRAALFGALQVFAGIYIVVLTSLPPRAWNAVGSGVFSYVLLLLPPSIASGAAFPLAVRMVVDDPALSSVAVGRMTALNTFGGIVGSLLVGFFALPWLGLMASVHLTSGASMLAGVAAWLMFTRHTDREGPDPRRYAPAALAMLAWIGLPLISDARYPRDLLAPEDRQLLAYREGRAANVAVVKKDDVIELTIDRLWQGQNRKNHQIMAAHVPMVLHPDPQSVLVIGVGAGLAPSRFLMHEPRKLDCCDIEPAVFELVEKYFDAVWMRDPAVRLLGEDGRNHVHHTALRYDVISIEVGQLFRSGVGGFYTADFYERAKAKLEPGGVVSQFVPLQFFSLERFASVVRTFVAVFPESVLWYNTTELLLLGFIDGVPQGDAPLGRLARPAVQEDLRYAHWGGRRYPLRDREVFFAGMLLGPSGLKKLSGEGPLHRDDEPSLAYWAGEVDLAATDERPIVAALRDSLDDVAATLGISPAQLDAERLARSGASISAISTRAPCCGASTWAGASSRKTSTFSAKPTI